MQKGSKVDAIYQALLAKGNSKAAAAKLAQYQTRMPLRTQAASHSRVGGRKWSK